jgi:heptosyltransferase-2
MTVGDGRARRILVVMPNWLGDLIMATPLLDLLWRAGDTAGGGLALHAVVRRRWMPLLSRDPRLARVVAYERSGRHAGWRGIPRLAADWRAEDAHAVVICPPSLRMGLVAAMARIPRRIGYATGGRGPLLTLGLSPVRPRGALHHSDELRRLGLALLEVLGLRPPEDAVAMPTLPGLDDLAPAPRVDGPPLWVLAPGATYGPAKTWPVDRVAEFLDLAVADGGVRVVIVGDTATSGFAAELRARSERLGWRRELAGGPGVIDLVGNTTLMDLAELLKGASGFLGNDSGVMHLAATLGTPTLGLFGSSSAEWTAPRGRFALALTASGFTCQPCFRKTCNREVFCLDTLTGLEVYGALRRLVDSAGQAGGA